jgi:hypothetical protein
LIKSFRLFLASPAWAPASDFHYARLLAVSGSAPHNSRSSSIFLYACIVYRILSLHPASWPCAHAIRVLDRGNAYHRIETENGAHDFVTVTCHDISFLDQHSMWSAHIDYLVRQGTMHLGEHSGR